jgi:hypothetical protein
MSRSAVTVWVALAAAATSSAALAGDPTAPAEGSAPPAWLRALDNEYYKVSVNVRVRMELADLDDLAASQAYTMRTRFGIGTKPRWGLSAYGEFENMFAVYPNQYWNTVEPANGRSPIADPPHIELNQAWLRYENPELAGLQLIGGRQRIVLDDERFVGNVGWRQNEQTFDAAWGQSSLGVEALKLGYGYTWDVHRIFGDEGTPAQRDWDSDSHLIRLAYERCELAKPVLFAYLLDFENAPPDNSANSFGFRLTGAKKFGAGPWSTDYALSYAYQMDAGDNPVDYGANYAAAEGNVGYDRIGKLGVGYELLGSDDGEARFVTPLATLHKFNGWADVFLDNGGPDGLQDFYAFVAPALPWKLTGRVVYHRFWSDQGGRHLGDELDAVVSRPLGTHVTVLTKGAWFAGADGGPVDRYRFWLELSFNY